VEERYRRVLLLDGGRGTGKTSLLLTLVRKWRVDAGVDRATGLTKASTRTGSGVSHNPPTAYGQAPTYVRVIRILDFDPLPPGMPLLAGIIQALRPLADRYDPRHCSQMTTSMTLATHCWICGVGCFAWPPSVGQQFRSQAV